MATCCNLVFQDIQSVWFLSDRTYYMYFYTPVFRCDIYGIAVHLSVVTMSGTLRWLLLIQISTRFLLGMMVLETWGFSLLSFIVRGLHSILSCNCVILSTNRGGQLNFSVIIPSPTKLRWDIVTLTSVLPFVRPSVTSLWTL